MIGWGHCPALLTPHGVARLGSLALAAAILAAGSGLTAPAFAQGTAQTAAAESLFREAVLLAKQKKFERAIAKFQASYELEPARGTLLGWAMAEERAGRLASALAHFQQLRDAAKKAGDKQREKAATSRIFKLLPKVPTLVVTSATPLPEGTELTLDGKPLPLGALGSQLPLEPGEHELQASAPDGATFTRRLSLDQGAREAVEIELEQAAESSTFPDTPKPSRDEPAEDDSGWTALRTTGFLLGVAGVGALGLGAYFWVESGNKFDEVEAACTPTCPPEQRPALQQKVDDGRSQENLARVALILGGIGTVTGITLFVAGARSDASEQGSVSLTVAPQSVSLTGRF